MKLYFEHIIIERYLLYILHYVYHKLDTLIYARANVDVRVSKLYFSHWVSTLFHERSSQLLWNEKWITRKSEKEKRRILVNEKEKGGRCARKKNGMFNGAVSGRKICQIHYVHEKRGATRISCMKLYRVGAISRHVAAGAFVYSIYRNNQSHEQYPEIYRLYEISDVRIKT